MVTLTVFCNLLVNTVPPPIRQPLVVQVKLLSGDQAEFLFIGGTANGNWDNPGLIIHRPCCHWQEKVIVNSLSIEAQLSFAGAMLCSKWGQHSFETFRFQMFGSCQGSFQNTNINYATGGAGFSFGCPILLEGDILLLLNSSSTSGSMMNLPGTFTGRV